MRRFFLSLAGVSLAAACAPVDQPVPGFGNAVRQNMAAHIVNPDPHPDDLPPPEMDGERVKGAIDRYREDRIKRPVTLQTTTIIRGEKK